MKVKIDIAQLLDLISRALLNIKNQGYSSVEIPYDQYWDIPFPDRYNSDVEPKEAGKKLFTPSLGEHWKWMQGILAHNHPDDVHTTLVLAGPLLTAVGEQFPTATAKQVAAAVKQVKVAWNMSEEDLYKHLGMASLGTESTSEAVGSMKILMSAAENKDTNAATRILGDDLLNKGQYLFDLLWEGLKDIVCTIYRDKIGVGDKDLAAYIVAALVASTTISNPLLVLVITIAVKKGLDKLCAT